MSSRTRKTPFPNYQSTAAGGIEKRYIRLGNSQLLHPALLSLSHLSFRVYVFMLLESGGKREFTFSRSKYCRWCSSGGFQGAVRELTQKGFIEIIERNKNRMKANKYRFSDRWKKWVGDGGDDTGRENHTEDQDRQQPEKP